MRRWRKKVKVFLGCATLLVLTFVLVEHIRGWWALGHRLKLLKAEGEEFSIDHLAPQRPPPDQNAYLALERLTNQISALLTNLDDVPPSLHFAALGKGIVAWRLKEWIPLGRKTTNDWSRMGPALADASNLFDRIHLALQKPAYDSGFDYHKGFQQMYLPSLSTVKQTAQVLSAETLFEMNQGHFEAAHERVEDLVKLVRSQTPEPLLILQLMRQACFSFAFNDTWEALQVPIWSEAQLASLQSAWEDCQLARDLAASMVMERALNLDYYQQLKHSHAKLSAALQVREAVEEMTDGGFGQAFGSLPTHGFFLHWVHAPLWQLAWADQDALFALNRWQSVIFLERKARSNSWAAVSSQARTEPGENPFLPMLGHVGQLGFYDKLRFLFAKETFSVNDIVTRRTLELQTQQQMVLTAIAIGRYRLAHGTLPPDLSSLVPTFLKTLPRDCMDGNVLRYELSQAGSFVLYSVGDDGRDNGGDPTASDPKKNYMRIWDGRDAIWPAPATDEEAASAFKSNIGQ